MLNEYQLDLSGLEKEIMPEFMRLKLNELSKKDQNEIMTAKTKLTQIKKDLDLIEERYATGKIESSFIKNSAQNIRKKFPL